jgi:CHAT domain-containing protein/tetratricopeptide (TPR) repeat protein
MLGDKQQGKAVRQRVTKEGIDLMNVARSAKLIGIVVWLIWLLPSAMTYGAPRLEQSFKAAIASPLLSSEARQAEVSELKQASPLARALASGQAHSYRINLQSGQYLNVVVEQIGINVEVALADPKGTQIANLDWWWREGTESLWALAEISGDYTLKVSAPSQPAETGKYRIKVEKIGEWQQAPAAEKDLVTAHKALGEGERLLAQGTAESLRQASEKLQAALALWRGLQAGDGEAQTLNNLGVVQYNLGKLKEAIEHISQALPRFRASGNRRGEAACLATLSGIYYVSGETQKALDGYNQALPLARAIKDYITETDALSGLGLVLNRLGQTQKAIDTLNELVSLSHTRGLIDGEAVAHNNLGLTYVGLGRLREAVEHYSQTLSLLEKSSDKSGRATTLANIGNAYTRMGEFQKALGFLLQGLELTRLIGDRRLEAVSLISVGFLYSNLGDYDRTLQYYSQSLALCRSVGLRDIEQTALGNMGTIHVAIGELPKARAYFNQALTLAVQLGNHSIEASSLAGLAAISNRLDDREKSLDDYGKALKIRREIGDQYGESLVLWATGVVYAQMENQQKALEYLNQALTLAGSIGDRLGEAANLYQLARIERARHNIPLARSEIERALNIVESTRTKVSLTDVRTTYFASRQNFYDFYIDLLMQSYKTEKDPKYLADALYANERRSARSLLDSLGEARADIRAGGSPELLEREHNLQQDLNAKTDQQLRLLSRKHTAEQTEGIAKEIAALTTEYEQVLAQIRQTSPRYAAITQPAPLGLKQIQAEVLGPDTLLLEYELGDEKSYLWVVSATAITGYELPKRAEIEALARQVYNLLTARNQQIKFETAQKRHHRIVEADTEYAQAAGALSEMLLGPIKGQMKSQRLLIVADGILQYIPFAALPSLEEATPAIPSKFTPLLAKHEVVNLPSASTLAVLRRELAGRQPAPKTVAVIADPVFNKDDRRVKRNRARTNPAEVMVRSAEERTDSKLLENELTRAARDFGPADGELYFPRLPSTRREAEAIMAVAPPALSRKAVDFAANKATVKDAALGQYRNLHFATHALINSAHPELSGIVLSLVDQHGADQDGFLTANEIYNLKLPAEMVVLSGCRTGLGKAVKGEGLIGLTRGFMYAGAARVLVSLWDVNDDSTAELMEQLYRGILGKQRLSPAAALRAAQLTLWKSERWQSPYYWAAFIHHGEYK